MKWKNNLVDTKKKKERVAGRWHNRLTHRLRPITRSVAGSTSACLSLAKYCPIFVNPGRSFYYRPCWDVISSRVFSSHFFAMIRKTWAFTTYLLGRGETGRAIYHEDTREKKSSDIFKLQISNGCRTTWNGRYIIIDLFVEVAGREDQIMDRESDLPLSILFVFEQSSISFLIIFNRVSRNAIIFALEKKRIVQTYPNYLRFDSRISSRRMRFDDQSINYCINWCERIERNNGWKSSSQ